MTASFPEPGAHWLLIVHAAPSSMPAQAAQELATAALAAGIAVTVFFHADGVYHALPVAATDPGLVALHERYSALAANHAGLDPALQLLVCRASLSRRSQCCTAAPWQLSGLIQLAALLQQADRVVSFDG